MKDAGIRVKEVRYAYDETWPNTSKMLQEQGITRTGKVPALEYQGLILIQACHSPSV
jgi:glutathione S-transferase